MYFGTSLHGGAQPSGRALDPPSEERPPDTHAPVDRVDLPPHVAAFEPHFRGDVLGERVAGQLAVTQCDTDILGEYDMLAVEVLAHLGDVEHPWHPVVRLRPVVQRTQLLDVVQRRSPELDRDHETDATDGSMRQWQALPSAP